MKALAAPVKHWRKRTCGEDYRLKVSPGNACLKICLLPETSELWTASLGQQPSHDAMLVIFFLPVCWWKRQKDKFDKMPHVESFCYQGRCKDIQEMKETNVFSTEAYAGTTQLLLIRTSEVQKSIFIPLIREQPMQSFGFCCLGFFVLFCFVLAKNTLPSHCFAIELIMVFKIYSVSLSWLVSHLS